MHAVLLVWPCMHSGLFHKRVHWEFIRFYKLIQFSMLLNHKKCSITVLLGVRILLVSTLIYRYCGNLGSYCGGNGLICMRGLWVLVIYWCICQTGTHPITKMRHISLWKYHKSDLGEMSKISTVINSVTSYFCKMYILQKPLRLCCCYVSRYWSH